MIPKMPVIDLLICRDGAAWRMYLAADSWVPGCLRARIDEHREVFPVAKPDAADLDAFMFEVDAPYERRIIADGGMEIVARGRSAIVLHEWLADLVRV